MVQPRRILYLGYWGANDVLTASSVFPSLRCLSAMENVEQIVFCSIERGTTTATTPELPPKVVHVPLVSKTKSNVLLTKFSDFTRFPIALWKLIKQHNINTVVCRSALAGGMILSITRLKGIPIIVESFEPHSQYMIDSNVWSKSDPRTRWARRMEQRLKRKATWLLPVSENYRQKLLTEGVPSSKMILIPCTVQTDRFALNSMVREDIRKQWNWTGLVVGIYIGKFGGIYYEAEAFEQFREAFRHFEDRFALIILTAQDGVKTLVDQYLRDDISPDRIQVLSVPHDRVVDYLSVADFAFSTIRPAPSRVYCSPIKHGEYWANGLPIIVEDGIGDDSNIIKRDGGGVILRRGDYGRAFDQVDAIVKQGRQEIYKDIRSLAIEHRSEEILKDAYKRILAQ